MKISHLRGLFRAPAREIEPPIRSELFSVERLEQHAESLAAVQRVVARIGKGRLLAPRLDDNARVLVEAYRSIVQATHNHQSITLAAEWLLDNFHIVDEQIREIQDDLPPGFYRLLPKLADGPLEGYPRVFGIAWALVAHTDSAFDVEKMTRFVQAYQRVQPLTIGELWAVAITLRITLVENLRRLAETIVERLAASRLADELADQILGTDQSAPLPTEQVLEILADTPWSTAFAVQLAQRLRDQDPALTPALVWLNEKLSAQDLTTEQIMREEVYSQSAINVTVRNAITSMRLISMINWADFFENVSPVDQILRKTKNYSAMDFPSRDLYRRAIEEIARGSGRDEIEVAKFAVKAAERANAASRERPEDSEAAQDVGYHLIAQGREAFEIKMGCTASLQTRLVRTYRDAGIFAYVGLIFIVTAIVLTLALLMIARLGATEGTLWLLGFVGILPASDIAVAVVNRFLTHQVGATLLPGLELREGIPDNLRSILVVPTLLSGVSSVQEQIERLEVHHLSNPDENLYFALLSDWRDSDEEIAKDDELLLSEAMAGIAQLNEKYAASAESKKFFLLHRRRVWNQGEQKWMGWERKRGKLHELNRLLRGANDTTFLPAAHTLPSDIRYVITLDSDTRLPIGAAKRLVGKIAHPLNRPYWDENTRKVTKGYGILQPRVTPSLPLGKEGSMYQRLFSGPNGLDPYALAVSDVYQDLYDEGSYCGKGIYELDIFEAALKGKIPENAVLSHDLLEGIYARAGLVSDIEVVEEFPSRYAVAAARQHRWVRGDWQLLPWIVGSFRKKYVPLIGKWKLLDNLRRSLSAPATLLSMLVSWLQPPMIAASWTGFVVLTIVLPPLLPPFVSLFPSRTISSLRNHLRNVREDFILGLLQSVFLVIFLAHQAWIMLDALVRTLVRLVRRRRLLEWVTAAQVNDQHQFDRRSLATQITLSAAFAALVATIVYLYGHSVWWIATPFGIVWVLSPVFARWASAPPPAAGHLSISTSDTRQLRLVARRTWLFFEKFVTPADNMLPPDNFQELPKPVVAHRTSPTNIGLYLLSTLAARDFGWAGTLDAVSRLESTFAAMNRLEKFRGHLFNWYDTTDLRALEPKYVSSVDSGNLAGHLVALENACRDMLSEPALHPQFLSGIKDAFDILAESAPAELGGTLAAIAEQLNDAPVRPSALVRQLELLARHAAILVEKATASADAGEQESELLAWATSFLHSIQSHYRDVSTLLPWAALVLESGLDDEVAARIDIMPSLGGIAAHSHFAIQKLTEIENLSASNHDGLKDAFNKSVSAAELLKHRLMSLSDSARSMFDAMEFGFLFDKDRQLLSIGYRESDGSLDSNFYDLLASEARLASFVAIAKGDIPAKHWFHLGRTLTPIHGGSALISWSGSMFEYLMPSLVMRAPTGSLLEQTNRLTVWRQEKYGDELGVPWGISESQYNARDIEQTYQYSGFGVPDLGYKRGLKENIVIAPYATGLAAMVDPAAAAQNFARMAKLGARGLYGWYEAIDYTPSRLQEGSKFAIVHAYMAHHHAMTIVSIANALQDGRMRARFHAEPIMRAAELLLQERMPRNVAVARPAPEETAAVVEIENLSTEIQRRYSSPHSRMPRTHILSNGRYSTMITATGSGYSRWGEVAITRWREDVTRDGWGSYIYIRDVNSGKTWSTGYHPSAVEPGSYDVTFFEDRAEIIRHDDDITTTLDVCVSPEDDAEVRRVSISNHGNREVEIELTSYAEIALARQPDDVAHPTFSKLFVQTEFVPGLGAILAHRRMRSSKDPVVWAAHLAVVEGETSGDVQFETDRLRFLGRGQTLRSAAAITEGWPLSNTSGAVLDPIFSLRRRVRIARGATARIAFWTLAASSREDVLSLADKHHDAMAFERAATLAWTQAQMQLHHLGIDSNDAHLYQRLANHVLYSDPTLRSTSDTIKRGIKKVSTLWAHGISGDLPIVLVRVEEDGDIELVRQILRAQDYWRLKQLAVDIVILNDRAASYVQDLQIALDTLIRTHQSVPRIAPGNVPGSIYSLRTDLISSEVNSLLQASARAVLYGNRGTLAEQINRARDRTPASPPPKWVPSTDAPEIRMPHEPLEFFNGLGGFANDGREYLTILEGNERTPAPWINVISNETFGFQVSTDGSGFTWSVNSQQNQLTPWSNDAVGDTPGEILYVRDDDTGEVWGPTSLPIREKTSSYRVAHGQGYSRFEHTSHGIALELLQYVPVSDSIKIARLKIANLSGKSRRLSITAYVEWVLGQNRGATAPFIVTEIDPETGALFAQNAWHDQFGERVAFADLNGRQSSWTGDRIEFVGRDGVLERPAALIPGRVLSNRVGAGLDPCGALQTHVNLSAVGTAEVVFFLGQTASRQEARELLAKYRDADLDAVFAEVSGQWDQILGTVQVKTPDRSLDILVNRWLPYQTLACRVWARAGFYQASGAYGFRDQLQDAMSLCLIRPDVSRSHLLRAAARQFVEGDVQHWWLPESGRGIRTRISDDKTWLAFAVARYIEATGDADVLEEQVSFLEGPVLSPEQHDAFFEPTVSQTQRSLFEHCALALDQALTSGPHGLPLIGTGDWNDGMDRVGQGGRGESVWLGWFNFSALNSFATIAEQHGRPECAVRWRRYAAQLQISLEKNAWDGDWYRRAYFDDGTPLGSVANNECRIDSIAQSWSVLSGAAEPTRAARAMAAVDKYLVRRDDKLSLLFTPPFDNSLRDPGYIKGYPPGIRENGGQYTHGAIWAAMAFAKQGDGDKAAELLGMLNPINHSSTPADCRRYKVEPYVACADVYSVPPHVGRGGWTWYTGSAGWMYTAILESLLGFRVRGATLTLDPCISHSWPGFEIAFQYRTTRYKIYVENPLRVSRGILAVKLDGAILKGDMHATIDLVDDGLDHSVQVVLG